MNILVCIKEVPDIESRFKVDAFGKWYDQQDLIYMINEYDNYAAEEAVKLKEKVQDSMLTVLSIGPERVKNAIVKVMAMGADKGVHVFTEKEHMTDSYQKAMVIAEYAKQNKYDVIFTGLQSQDKSSAQVGPMIAEMLEMDCIMSITRLEVTEDGNFLVEKELEGGLKAEIEVHLPVVLGCQSGLNTPRYVSLMNLRKASKKELVTIEIKELRKSEALIDTVEVFKPKSSGEGLLLDGKAEELADQLINILKEKTDIL